MSAVKDQATSVTRQQVPENERSEFLPARVGMHYLPFEFYIYDIAGDQSNYRGGHWEFYSLSNGGWYLAPDSGTFDVSCPNGYSGQMSEDAFGIAFSLIAINHLLWQVHRKDPNLGRKLHDAFYALRDYACEHKEAAEILGVID